MNRSKVRAFATIDAMVLIAAIGIGLAVIRLFSPAYYVWPHTPIPPPTWVEWSAFVIPAWAFYTMPVPAVLTLSVLALRARRPVSPVRLTFGDAGVVAALGASVAITAGVVYFVLDLRITSWHETPFEYATYSAGVAVAAAWAGLAATGSWRSQRDWIDLLGRILGCYWMLLVPVVMCRCFAR